MTPIGVQSTQASATEAVPMPRHKPRPPRRVAAVPAEAASARGEAPEPSSSPVQETAAPQALAAPADAPAPGPASGGTAAALPEPDPEARPRATPETLVGLDEPAMRRLLGEPTWTEDQPPVRYWQYASRSCVLRVFFFLEMDTKRFRALSYELKSTDDAPHVDEQCFDQLLRQASSRPAALAQSR